MKPKSVKSFLKMCIELAEMNRDELKGIGKITEQEYMKLGDLRAGIQNDLGEMFELLDKYNLRYKS